MKKIIPLSAAFLAMTLAAFSYTKANHYVKASAYEKTSLPTTIKLNDNTASEIRNYYSNLNALSNEEKRGQNLLKNLKPILSNGQKYFSYDKNSGKEIWQMYEITDRDWDKSPASEISGYDSATNTINGYVYGSSKSDKQSNPYIHALYVDRNTENHVRAWEVEDGSRVSHGDNAQYCIDREHIWPKSHGFDDTNNATYGARGDPMHLWAGDSYVNSALHNNYYYGYVDTSVDYTDYTDLKKDSEKFAYTAGNMMGVSKTLGGTGNVFEPCDSDKGDIARAVFYMVARYNNIAGTDTNIDTDNPNLKLENSLEGNNAVGTSTATVPYAMGIMSDLLEWNKLDPVDDYEIHRNNLLFNNFTNNRNPFIDFPQWADVIWGESADVANPASDIINDNAIIFEIVNGKNGNISVNGDPLQLKATTVDNSPISWSVEDASIVSIDKTTTSSGEVINITALKNGRTKVIASATVDGKETKKVFNVSVNPRGFNLQEFIKANLIWIIILGVAVVVLLVVILILFSKYGSKKAKKKVGKAVKKTVKKTEKNGGKSSSKSKK